MPRINPQHRKNPLKNNLIFNDSFTEDNEHEEAALIGLSQWITIQQDNITNTLASMYDDSNLLGI